MSASELLARLSETLPNPEAIEPAAFLSDELLPSALSPVEPAAFTLACAQVLWGPGGPRN